MSWLELSSLGRGLVVTDRAWRGGIFHCWGRLGIWLSLLGREGDWGYHYRLGIAGRSATRAIFTRDCWDYHCQGLMGRGMIITTHCRTQDVRGFHCLGGA